LVEDRLFATLDPRARRVGLGEEMTAVLTDTVGFIRKLPHHLVAPFRSTLEEATEADLVLHVVDAAHGRWDEHLRVGEEVLDSLDVERERVLVVLNKSDLLPDGRGPLLADGRGAVIVSAVTGSGVDQLLARIRSEVVSARGVSILRVPLAEAEMVERAVKLPHQLARRFRSQVLEVAVRADGESLTALGLAEFRVEAWARGGD
jgi:GTP-binding protein HflX